MSNDISYTPIGIIHSPFKIAKGTPIQSAVSKDKEGTVEVFHEFCDGLKDLSGFSHIILIFHFHLSEKASLIVKPFLDVETRGVFATRAPRRPNPIGMSIVKIEKIEENYIHIRDFDILDGTPLLDIKPFIPQFDNREIARIGWMEKNIDKLSETKDDGRFTNQDL